MTPRAAPPAEPFFLDVEGGQRFCVFHAPAGACRGALVYVHPFAEEMNRSRRMAALASRALAASGVAVLQVDLLGCGDSSGEFADARWDAWKDDLAAACAWLRGHTSRPVGLWGLRLGALLALDYAHGAAEKPERLVLWQPVASGSTFLTQFLRLRLARDMLGPNAAPGATSALRAALQRGELLDIAGYQLAPQLAAAIDGADAAGLAPAGIPTDWFDLARAPRQGLSIAAERLAGRWRDAGAAPVLHAVECEAFWSSQEIAVCPALVEATVAALGERCDA